MDREEAIARREREEVGQQTAGRLTEDYQSVYRRRSLFGDPALSVPVAAPKTPAAAPTGDYSAGMVNTPYGPLQSPMPIRIDRNNPFTRLFIPKGS